MLIFSGILKDLKAEDAQEKEYKTMEQMKGEIRLEKKQVELMIDKMVTSGRFSTDEGAKAKRELASMKESDLESLKTAAISQVKSKKLFDQ
jgi:hypothetical protein